LAETINRLILMRRHVKNHPTPAVGRHVKFVQFVIIMNDAWTQLTQTLWMRVLVRGARQ